MLENWKRVIITKGFHGQYHASNRDEDDAEYEKPGYLMAFSQYKCGQKNKYYRQRPNQRVNNGNIPGTVGAGERRQVASQKKSGEHHK